MKFIRNKKLVDEKDLKINNIITIPDNKVDINIIQHDDEYLWYLITQNIRYICGDVGNGNYKILEIVKNA